MSRNLMAGRAKLTEVERGVLDASLIVAEDVGQDQRAVEDRVFHEQLRIARARIRETRQARRARRRDR